MPSKRSNKKTANTPKQRRRPGRPTDYSAELAHEICCRIGEGKSLTSICKARGMPSYRTVMRWRSDDDVFRQMYAGARQDGADTYADQICGLIERVEKGKLDPNAGRVCIDGLKWIASKLKPRAYGDRLELAGKIATEPLADQAPDWLKAGIAERTKAAEKAKGKAPAPNGADTLPTPPPNA